MFLLPTLYHSEYLNPLTIRSSKGRDFSRVSITKDYHKNDNNLVLMRYKSESKVLNSYRKF